VKDGDEEQWNLRDRMEGKVEKTRGKGRAREERKEGKRAVIMQNFSLR
jgi:hypothetical protein